MGHTGIFATSSEILTKAGASYSTGVTEAKINELCLQAESHICCETRYNWVDKWTLGLNVDVKYILSEAESNLVAMYIVSYDMSGYASVNEAQTRLDVLDSAFKKCMDLLREPTTAKFVQEA